MILRRNVLAGGVAALGLAAGAAGAAVSGAAWREDAAILRSALTALHPGLLRYNTGTEMQARFDALAGAAPGTLAAAHLACARLCAAIRCGHSFLNPENQTGAALDLIAGGRTRLPWLFRWIDGRMIVLACLSPHADVARGSEIVSINGVRCGDLLAGLIALAPADGHNDARRIRLMELRGDDWELFDIYLPLLLGRLVADGKVLAGVRSFDGQVRSVETPLLTRAEKLAATPFLRAAPDAAWRLRYLPQGPALLTMKSWAVFNSKRDWRGDLNALFDELADRQQAALIIDLRGNAGGLDVGSVILSRLAMADVSTTRLHRRTRYRQVPAALNPYLHTWDNSFRDWGTAARGPGPDGFYELADGEDGGMIRPSGKRYAGRVAVLTDAANSSATFMFAQTVKAHGLAMLIGQTSGGSCRGINGGAFFFLKLPNTGLEIDVPLIGYFPDGLQPESGVVPDIAVPVTQADVAAGRDPEMARAIISTQRS